MQQLSTADLQRRTDLRRMKRLALALLVFVTIVFLVARWQEDRHGWVGYVRAFAEAAMVGALADWFAVTALFRHPLGLPIPHTAIIPNRKDQIGQSLGEFVQENFLTREVLHERLDQARVGQRIGTGRADATNAATAGPAVADAITQFQDTYHLLKKVTHDPAARTVVPPPPPHMVPSYTYTSLDKTE
jgi:uncharacterized membrane-anchored protein YjiN (DUF445 family)